MNMKKWIAAALSAAAAAGLIVSLLQPEAGPPLAAPGVPGAPGTPAAMARPAAGLADSAAGLGGGGASAPVAPGSAAAWFGLPRSGTSHDMVSPLSTMSPPRFVADSRGRLVLNSDTHANLEKLLLDENPDTMRASLDRISKDLPPQAAAELKVLVAQFQQYSKALSHSISPENAPENEREGLQLLDSLHTLRVSYLGAESARAMFGSEEATTRQLIALMESQKDTNLTQQQKAERAQEIMSRQTLPQAPPSS